MKIELVYYLSECMVFKGRLLGLLDEKQFANLHTKPKRLAKKIGTGGSTSLTALSKTKVNKHRLVMTTTENGLARLLVTRPLDDIYNCIYNEKEVETIGFLDDKENWLTLEKK